MNDLRYWVGFNLVRGIGPMRLRALLNFFDDDIAAAWKAPDHDLREAGLDSRSRQNLLKTRTTVDLDKTLRAIDKVGARVLTLKDADYPRLLLELEDAPPVLYVKGTLEPADEWAVAIVGTRKVTVYGRQVAHQIASDLARAGATIVSGMARGVDGIAHRAALKAGGRTIAVFGCGIDYIYPREHRNLAAEIMEHGALISDYPLGMPPEAANFPPRNRIISGLSRGVVVVEAGARSGALITADFAADQGREVFAIPGSILNRASVGCNRLIRDGAHVVLEARDVLEPLHMDRLEEKQAMRQIIPDNPTEALILEHLSAEPRHMDELVRAIDLSTETVSSTLVMMELKGMVRQVGTLQYVLARESTIAYET
jgi:DNA processing protein